MFNKAVLKKIPGAIVAYELLLNFKEKIFVVHKVGLYFKQYKKFKTLSSKQNRFKTSWSYRAAITFENTSNTAFDRHYIYHTAWAARCLKTSGAQLHIDISSSLYFSALCSAFTTIQFYDFRPPKLELSNLSCGSADLTKLHFKDSSIDSLSCMHTVEHIGLGRYGDPIDSEGDLKAIDELIRVLAVGGNLFFVVPLGATPQIQFNAHRIYTYEQIVSYFERLHLKEFTLIGESDKHGGLVSNPPKALLMEQKYACGCFWFTKEKQMA